MRFIAAITHRSFGDSDGKGWPAMSTAKEFEPETSIQKIWDWYLNERLAGAGILEIIQIQDE